MVGMLKSQEWFSDHPDDTLYHLVFCKAPHRVSAPGQCSWRHPYIVVRNTGWVCLAPILLSPVWAIHHWIIMDDTEHIYTHPFYLFYMLLAIAHQSDKLFAHLFSIMPSSLVLETPCCFGLFHKLKFFGGAGTCTVAGFCTSVQMIPLLQQWLHEASNSLRKRKLVCYWGYVFLASV